MNSTKSTCPHPPNHHQLHNPWKRPPSSLTLTQKPPHNPPLHIQSPPLPFSHPTFPQLYHDLPSITIPVLQYSFPFPTPTSQPPFQKIPCLKNSHLLLSGLRLRSEYLPLVVLWDLPGDLECLLLLLVKLLGLGLRERERSMANNEQPSPSVIVAQK